MANALVTALVVVLLAAGLGLVWTVTALAGGGRTATAATGPVRWLCRPGMAHDPCTSPLTTTVVAPTGKRTVQRPAPSRHPAIDCFYVYPTVSTEQAVNANWKVQAAERTAAELQASWFSRDCRVYAPVYRQLTLYALANRGAVTRADVHRAYEDVAKAWDYYLSHDNHGRGVVLIGHSQGAVMLVNLIRHQIDDRPAIRRRLVSAILLGGNVAVATGKDVGGSFHHVPACRSADQLHCVVAYSSYITTAPADAYFGKLTQGEGPPDPATSRPGLQVLCTNPASLSGGSGALLPYLPRSFPGADVATPWVAYPHMYRGQCQVRDGVSFLAVGDVAPWWDHNAVLSRGNPVWGLHDDDVNVALGNLVAIVRHESAAYVAGG